VLQTARLRAVGVPVTISCYNGMIHEFMGMGAVIDQDTRSVAECVHALRAPTREVRWPATRGSHERQDGGRWR